MAARRAMLAVRQVGVLAVIRGGGHCAVMRGARLRGVMIMVVRLGDLHGGRLRGLRGGRHGRLAGSRKNPQRQRGRQQSREQELRESMTPHGRAQNIAFAGR
jgi:hypothetical protein